jgi:hypothetical protein
MPSQEKLNKAPAGAQTALQSPNTLPALGMWPCTAAGAMKILYDLPLIWFLLGKYALALGLTVVNEESITAVAWDSAGVTTGPVTVPFVLAIGIGFSQAVDSAEGFGLLTVMSVAPIISVLVFALLRKPAKTARKQLSRAARSVQRSMRRRAAEEEKTGHAPQKKLKHGQSTVQVGANVLFVWAACA